LRADFQEFVNQANKQSTGWQAGRYGEGWCKGSKESSGETDQHVVELWIELANIPQQCFAVNDRATFNVQRFKCNKKKTATIRGVRED